MNFHCTPGGGSMLSRRAMLGGLAAVLGKPWSLHAQDATVEMIPVTGEGARYWSRWRGPSGQGLVDGGPYPDTWSATDNIRWKTPVPGRGNSSPVVWGDRIFLTAAGDNGRQSSVIGFRRSDGVQLWQTPVPAG